MPMLDDETLYQTSNYVIFDADISFALKEGTITRKISHGDFGKVETWDVAGELKKGDLVELVPNKRMEVQKATGSKPIFGEIIDEPHFMPGTRYPKRDTGAYGEYTPRRATVRVYGCFVHEMPLVAENKEIKAGDSLAFDADEQAFDKSSSKTNIIALEPRGALETGKIATLMGSFAIE